MATVDQLITASSQRKARKSRDKLPAPHAPIILSLIAAACAPAGTTGSAGGRSDLSQPAAAVALAAFGENNKACRMWTNWQSLCSRTGPGMSATCKQDPGFPVAPSAPFCVSQRVPPGTVYDAETDTPTERASRNRFCDRYAGQPGSMQPAGPSPKCEIYAAKRPFDGRRAEAVAHPLCRRWQPSASDVGTQACAEWAADLPCKRLIGNAYRHPAEGPILLTSVRHYQSQPVWGVYCIEEE